MTSICIRKEYRVVKVRILTHLYCTRSNKCLRNKYYWFFTLLGLQVVIILLI